VNGPCRLLGALQPRIADWAAGAAPPPATAPGYRVPFTAGFRPLSLSVAPVLPLLSLLPSPPSHVALGSYPSPLEFYPSLGRELGFECLLVKRDDANSDSLGGNKVRALEWILPAARQELLSLGGIGSTWCASLARYGAAHGHRVALTLVVQPWSSTVRGALACSTAHAEVRLARSIAAIPLQLARLRWGAARRAAGVSWLPPGGATPLGALGSVNAALELVQQVEQSGIAPPDLVVVPLGSGGTAAGLVAGFDLAGWDLTVCGVAVAPRWATGRARVERLTRGVQRLLGRSGVTLRRRRVAFRVVWSQLGSGYGHPTARGAAAQQRLAELPLMVDQCYGAKTFAALPDLAGSFRRPCFWHTFDARLGTLPPAGPEHPLLRIAREHAESLWPSRK
jgi:D-cysteine desulfhydrase